MVRLKSLGTMAKFAHVTFPSLHHDVNLFLVTLTWTQDTVVPVAIELIEIYTQVAWQCNVLDFADHAHYSSPAIPARTVLNALDGALRPLAMQVVSGRRGTGGSHAIRSSLDLAQLGLGLLRVTLTLACEQNRGRRPSCYEFYFVPAMAVQVPRPRSSVDRSAVLFVATTKWTRYPLPVEWDVHTVPWSQFTLKKNTKAIVVLHAGHYQVHLATLASQTDVHLKLRLNGVAFDAAPCQYLPQYGVLSVHSRVQSHAPVAMYLHRLTQQVFI